MGLHDRDYYRDSDASPWSGGIRSWSVVMVLIAITLLVWVFQMILAPIQDGELYRSFQDIFAGSTAGLFDRLYLWQPFTACFLHDARPGFGAVGHVALNLVVLYLFGRELEQRLGKGDFLFFYLVSGTLGMTLHLLLSRLLGWEGSVVGASAGTTAVFVLYTLLNPHRQLLIPFTLVRIPLWWICAFLVSMDLVFAFFPGSEVAHFAHLGGAGFAVLFHFVDLRWSTLTRALRPRRRARRPSESANPGSAKIFAFPARTEAEHHEGEDAHVLSADASGGPDREIDKISLRIDELLDKISKSGQDSLSHEELEFLRDNSGKYRSRR